MKFTKWLRLMSMAPFILMVDLGAVACLCTPNPKFALIVYGICVFLSVWTFLFGIIAD